MGLIPMEDRKPGLRVRHRRELWTGTVVEVMPNREVIGVDPDGGRGPRWFDTDLFEPWPVPLPDVPPREAIRRRYLTDPVFHQLVTYQRQLLVMAREMRGEKADQDLADAVALAVELEKERAIRRGAADGDVRGKGQTDAQEERGTHRPGQPKP